MDLKKIYKHLFAAGIFSLWFNFSMGQALQVWGTFYGDANNDHGYDVTTDAAGNVYMSGWTSSTTGIASGGFKNSLSGTCDAYLVKFDAAGNRIWGTYYGGPGDEGGFGTYGAFAVTTDISGNVYLAGHTNSSSGIASGGFQNSYGGGATDAFLVKFDAAGNRLWATYYGGTDYEYSAFNVATDASGNVYLAGMTKSPLNIASGGHQNTLKGSKDAFLVKFDASGNRLWATYYGGPGEDEAFALTTDPTGNVVIGGWTYSVSDISFNGHQSIFNGGTQDAFVVKFDASGNRLWGTYYGGAFNDVGYNLDTDALGNIYFSGTSDSPTDIATAGGFQNTLASGSDAFLVKFNPVGNRIWGTYYGGNGFDIANGLTCDVVGNVYIAGSTTSSGLASGGFRNTFVPFFDEYLAAFDACGNRVCATYFAGTSDRATHICLDGQGSVYMTGSTDITSGISSMGFQNNHGGASDAYLSKFTSCITALFVNSASTNVNCNNACTGTATANAAGGSGSYSYLWNTGVTSQTATGLCAGVYTVTVSDACSSFIDSITITEPPALSVNAATINDVDCYGQCTGSAQLNAVGGTTPYTYLWNNGQAVVQATALCAANYSATITDANGCIITQSISITQPTAITASTTSTSACFNPFDGEASVSINGGTSPYNYLWSPTNNITNSITGIGPGIYSCTITDALGCIKIETINVIAKPSPIANAGADISISRGQNITLSASGGGSYYWTPSSGLSCISCANPSITNIQQNLEYILTVTNNDGCIDDDTITVTVNDLCNDFFIPNAFSPNNDGNNDIFLIHGTCIDRFTLKIFNRWGEIVFESNDATIGWNGEYRGQPLDTDLYTYTLNMTLTNDSEIVKTGNIYLIK